MRGITADLTRFMEYQRNIIDTQGSCKAFCQQQETADWKQSLHDGASGFETNSANIKLLNINRRLSESVFGINLSSSGLKSIAS